MHDIDGIQCEFLFDVDYIVIIQLTHRDAISLHSRFLYCFVKIIFEALHIRIVGTKWKRKLLFAGVGLW